MTRGAPTSKVGNARLGRWRRVDVLVAGAGPAGAAAAIAAADRGLDVVVCDRARFPRDKTCGDGLTTQALRLLEHLGLDHADLLGAGYVAGARGGARIAAGPRDQPAAADRRRARGHRAPGRARRRARLCGPSARCRRPRRCRGDRPRSRDRWREGAHRHGRNDRGAPSRRRRRSLVDRAPAPPSRRAARSRHVACSAPVLRRHRRRRACGSFFFEDLLPGYAWVFPTSRRRRQRRLRRAPREAAAAATSKALWPDLLARPALRAVLGERAQPDETVHAWPIPTAYTPTRLTDGPVLYVGDAAAVVDPMTGEGIAQALETGMLAVDAIAAGGDSRCCCARVPARRRPRPRARPASRRCDCNGSSRPRGGAVATIKRGRLLRLDVPQLRPLAVRGLSARGRCSRPTAGGDGVSRHRARSGRLPPRSGEPWLTAKQK